MLLKRSMSRVLLLMNLSASSSPLKKSCMNFVSALNFVPMTSSGSAFAIYLPSRSGETLDMSRKAEFLFAAGGVLVERGRVLFRLLWVLTQEKISNTLWNRGSWILESVSIGVLLATWVFIVSI